MANNATLFDAALAGASSGFLEERDFNSSVAANYLSIKNKAVAVATEVDSLIAAGAPTVPQANLLGALTKAKCKGRYASSVTATDYATLAAQIVAAYTEISAALV